MSSTLILPRMETKKKLNTSNFQTQKVLEMPAWTMKQRTEFMKTRLEMKSNTGLVTMVPTYLPLRLPSFSQENEEGRIWHQNECDHWELFPDIFE